MGSVCFDLDFDLPTFFDTLECSELENRCFHFFKNENSRHFVLQNGRHIITIHSLSQLPSELQSQN